MLVPVAEVSYQKGMDYLDEGRFKEALAFFESAVSLEQRYGVPRPQARYLSYYGLSLALTKLRLNEAVRCCRSAASLERYNADIRCNLVRVLLAAGKRKEAFIAAHRGLRVEPGHAGLRREIRRMGLRRRPVLPFLARGNPLNIYLGRLRNS